MTRIVSLALLLTLALAATAAAAPSGVVISELRFRGPAGGNDEFVELANTTAAPVDVGGWRLVGCSATAPTGARATIPTGVSIPAGTRYLIANAAGSTPGDLSYATGIGDTGGARLESADGTLQDTVGATATVATCREGAGVPFPTANADSSFERAGGTQDTGDNAADLALRSPAAPQACGTACAAPPPPCSGAVVAIHEIQGPGLGSPCVGTTVTIEGVVTGVDDQIGQSSSGATFPEDAGVFVQEEAPDADPATSEGIFVGFVSGRPATLIGQRVRITGRVGEKFGQTQIAEAIGQEPTILGPGTLPAAATIDPADAAAQAVASDGSRAYYEALEGMRVRLATGTANSGGTTKFGELFLTPGTERKRVFRTDPAPALIATAADAGAGDPDNPAHPPAPSTTIVKADLFDRVDDLVGPLGFSFGNYKVLPQVGALPTVTKGPTRFPYRLQRTLGFRIASFNVENFFPAGGELDNAIVTPQEYAEKRDRIVDAVDRLLGRPEIVAVEEVVNKQILDDVAARLRGYTAFLEEGNDNRGIDVGFLVKRGVPVRNERQLGKDAPGSCSDVAGRLFDRPPLALDVGVGRIGFTVIVNHFASKAAPDSCREAQAAFVRDQVAALEADRRQAIVVGDLNAFEDESALGVLQDPTTTLTNLWSRAPASERYSFAFDGKLQTLDHVLITDGLDRWVTDFRYAHFDNDYYDRGAAGGGHKVSDHDPPVLTLGPPGWN